MRTYQPTAQQVAIADVSELGETFKCKARAGTGKTSTATLVASRNIAKNVLYIVFNKAAQREAEAKMPKNTQSRTAHSLAFVDVISRGPWRGRELGSIFEVVSEVENNPVIADVMEIAAGDERAAAFAVVKTLERWANSAAPAPGPEHVPKEVTHLIPNAKARKEASSTVARTALRLWEMISDRGSRMKITHDFYLKYWQLNASTRLDAEMLMLDESQDLSPVMLDVVQRQGVPIVAFGDDQQQIYSWRGAVNAMRMLKGNTLPLTKSWRFGPEIAGMANEILKILGETWLLSGGGPTGVVRDEPMDLRGEAVLCRGNSGVIRETIDSLDRGNLTAVVGGTTEAVQLLYACWDLFCKRPVRHPEIGLFRSWFELEKFSESEEGNNFRPVVKMVEQYRGAIPSLCKRLRWDTVDERDAEVKVSTAHKAKGREWDTVRLCEDFGQLTEEEKPGKWTLNKEEANLVYVAITRARKELNLAGYGQRLMEDQARLSSGGAGLAYSEEKIMEDLSFDV